jgi:hypothetical protein
MFVRLKILASVRRTRGMRTIAKFAVPAESVKVTAILTTSAGLDLLVWQMLERIMAGAQTLMYAL